MIRAPKTTRTAVVTALVIPALVLSPSADADKRKYKDPKGDGPKAIDITRFKAVNGKKRNTFVLTFRHLRLKQLWQVVGVSRPKAGRDDLTHFSFGLQRYPKGLYVTFQGFGEVENFRCKDVTVKRPKKNTLRISAAQKCFRKWKGPMTMYAKAFKANWKGDSTDGGLEYIKRG